MTMKQREDHAQAKYWNGFITRVEAQKVFDEQTAVIVRQAEAMAKFDAAISCLAEKAGITPVDVNAWVTKKIAEAQKKQEEAKANANNQPDAGSDDTKQEVSSLIAA